MSLGGRDLRETDAAMAVTTCMGDAVAEMGCFYLTEKSSWAYRSASNVRGLGDGSSTEGRGKERDLQPQLLQLHPARGGPSSMPSLSPSSPRSRCSPSSSMSSSDSCWPACREETACAGGGPGLHCAAAHCQTARLTAGPASELPPGLCFGACSSKQTGCRDPQVWNLLWRGADPDRQRAQGEATATMGLEGDSWVTASPQKAKSRTTAGQLPPSKRERLRWVEPMWLSVDLGAAWENRRRALAQGEWAGDGHERALHEFAWRSLRR